MVKNTTHSLVMFNMSTWREWEMGNTNRNREIVTELRRRDDIDKILLIDFLPHRFKRAARFILKEFPFYRSKLKNILEIDRGLYHIDHKTYLFSSILPIFGSKSEMLMYKRINDIQKNLHFQHTILWSYIPLFSDYFTAVSSSLKIFDCVDNWMEHSMYANEKERLQKNYQIIKKQADIIFTVSNDLLNLFQGHRSAYFMPNGVRPFTHVLLRNPKKRGNVIRVGYIGVIQDRIDERILDTIGNDPRFLLAMHGPVWKNFNTEKYARHPRIAFTNRIIPHDQFPDVLKDIDVMIIPHKVNAFTKSMNPMKLYDYLACGKPIVSTQLHDLLDLARFVEIAHSPKDFPQLIIKAAGGDSEALQQARINAIKKHSWESIVQNMMGHITRIS